ncbi:MAG: hypothetical protein H9Q65_05150 [Spiroplasma ixodetis]|nr:hypothetical protein [Spiroplasma ixodetis]MBP1527371.1 hypothetical protein [Spiroplasma ixodetis]MBP1528611.1 hypothetical protein [Spiroplasma ixodetis]
MKINQKQWKQYIKGMGIRVKITDDIDKETGKQKYRPAIVIKSYPSHVKVQLMTTESSNHDYYKIKINNQIQYIRPIYYRTIPLEWVNQKWIDNNKKQIFISKNNSLFIKIQEMEIKENLGYKIDLKKIKKVLNENQNFRQENKQLKKQICMQSLKDIFRK